MSALKATFHAELNALHHEIAKLKQNRQHIDTTHPVDFYQETIRALIQKLPSPAAVAPPAVAPAVASAEAPAAHVEPPAPAHTPAPAPAPAAPPAVAPAVAPAAALAAAAAPAAPATRTAAAARATTSAPAAVAPPVRTTATAAKPPRQKRIEIIGDSMLGGVRNWQKNNYYVKVNAFGGATSQDTVEMAEIALRREPDMLIVHAGTNDFDHNIQTKKEVQRVISKARGKFADINIAISAICHREDRKHLQPKIKDMNNQLKTLCRQQQVTFIDHSDFDHSCLAYKGLHPNPNGNKSLYCDFDRTISSVV